MASRKVKLHVFYGIPCVGKSTTAVHFAYEQGIRTIIHTDYVRELQRSFLPAEQVPVLAKLTHTAWDLYGPPTRANIETGFVEHVRVVAAGVNTIAKKLVSDGFDAVLEGVHFNSAVIEELRATNIGAEITATLLTVGTAEELLKRVEAKGASRAQGAPQKLWRENMQTMLTIQEFLIRDARSHGTRVVEVNEGGFLALRRNNDTARPGPCRDG